MQIVFILYKRNCKKTVVKAFFPIPCKIVEKLIKFMDTKGNICRINISLLNALLYGTNLYDYI